MAGSEFMEIAHCGGRVTLSVTTAADGRRQYQVGVTHCAPVAAAWFAVYAIPQGFPVETIQLGGIGDPWNAPPVPGCYPVFIASDSEGMFGCECPRCHNYWRTRGAARFCPYCGVRAKRHNFLTQAQRQYIFEYCEELSRALDNEKDGEYVIDMDAVADATGKDREKPPFYYSEERQQTLLACEACGATSDILGSYGYCSACRTRNDLQQLDLILKALRDELASARALEGYVKQSVGLFDSFVREGLNKV